MTSNKLKFISFALNKLNLALPIEKVYKIVNHTPVHSSGTSPISIPHIGENEVTVVDLSRHFFKDKYNNETANYMIIVKNQTEESYGITVTKTPILLEIALSMIRILPESYRRADTLAIARHVAVIPTDTTPNTVFLLDVELLLPLCQEISKPLT